MLSKMIFQGIIAAVLIGSAAVVYAQVNDTRQQKVVNTQERSVAESESGYRRPDILSAFGPQEQKVRRPEHDRDGDDD